MFKNRTLCTGFLLLMLSQTVKASVVSGNDPSITPLSGKSVFGTGNVTVDTATGLAWLDLTLSIDMSFPEVQAQLGPGGAFAGYRFATTTEISAFWQNAGIIVTNFNQFEDSTAIGALQAMWGGVDSNFGFSSIVHSEPLPDNSFAFDAYLQNRLDGGAFNGLDFAVAPFGTSLADEHLIGGGSALVRDANTIIPEPSSLLIWASIGLCGSVATYMRRRAG